MDFSLLFDREHANATPLATPTPFASQTLTNPLLPPNGSTRTERSPIVNLLCDIVSWMSSPKFDSESARVVLRCGQ